MNKKEKLIVQENAYKDYIYGIKYKDIAEKYNVSINTVKSWKRRLNWQRDLHTKKCAKVQKLQEMGNKIFSEIKKDLLSQLKENGTHGMQYEDLINDYMALWNIKNELIYDVKEYGTKIKWNNGKQNGIKRNEAIDQLNKTNNQMLKILNDLGLKPSPKSDEWDDNLEM